MTRKLRNSLAALLLTSAVCTLGAVSIAALPFGFEAGAAGASAQSAFDADASGPALRRKAGKTHRMRSSLGMPYFSFVPRG